MYGDLEMPAQEYADFARPLKELKQLQSLGYIDSDAFFCPRGACGVMDGDELNVYDNVHFTQSGAYRFALFLLGKLEQVK